MAQPNGSPVNFGKSTLRGAIRLVDGRSEERSQVVEAAAGGASVAIMARAWAMSSLIVVESSESSAEWGRGEEGGIEVFDGFEFDPVFLVRRGHVDGEGLVDGG